MHPTDSSTMTYTECKRVLAAMAVGLIFVVSMGLLRRFGCI